MSATGMTDRRPPLHLPRPQLRPVEIRRQTRRRRRRSGRLGQAGAGLLLGAAGVAILMLLVRLPEWLDTLLLVSNAVANLIGGLGRFMTGVLQLAGVLGVGVLALFALLLLVAGGVRLIRAAAPRPGKIP
jgi:hypothetical protein